MSASRKCYLCRYSRWLVDGVVAGDPRSVMNVRRFERVFDDGRRGESREAMRCVKHRVLVETYNSCDQFAKYRAMRRGRARGRPYAPTVTVPANKKKRVELLGEADFDGKREERRVLEGDVFTIVNPSGDREVMAQLVGGRLRLLFRRGGLETAIHLTKTIAEYLSYMLPSAYTTSWPGIEVRCLDGVLRIMHVPYGEGVVSVTAAISNSGPWNVEVLLTRENAQRFADLIEVYLSVMEKYAYPNGELIHEDEARHEFRGLIAMVSL